MGEVYRAHDARLGRDVAIKILPTAFAADADRVARFEREARVLASLNHPNIATIHGVEESASIRAIVLELVEGETVADRIARGRLPLVEALAIAGQIAEALDAAHERGIVHRDLKPSNIKITPDGRVKVLDFGLVKLAERVEAGRADDVNEAITTPAGTQLGMVVGTAPYMSPEQARGLPVDKRTDIWAFGCVLYEMLTGRVAFSRPTLSDTLAAILERQPDLTAMPASVPRPVVLLLHRCLEKDPRQRLRDIGDARAIWEADGHEESVPQQWWTMRRLASWVGTAMLAGAIGAALAWPRDSIDPVPRRLSILPPAGTTFTARDITGHPQFALSPDSTTLAFVAERPGETPELWVRLLASAAARPLPGTENATGPFWSPDSRSLAFFAQGKLKTVSVDGGAARELADVSVDVTSGTWNADSVILFGGATASGLSRVSADGGAPVPETTLDARRGESGHRWPSFLPDGRRYLFFVRSTMPVQSGIYLGMLGSTDKRMLVETTANGAYVDPGQVLFERSGTLTRQRFNLSSGQLVGEPLSVGDQILGLRGPSYLPISSARDGTLAYWTGPPTPTRLEWFDRTGRSLGTIAASARADAPVMSPDGRRLAFTERPNNNQTNLITIDLADGATSRVAFSTLGPGMARFSIWSPDSQHIVFSTNDAGGPRILQKAVSGAGSEAVILEGSAQWAVFPDDWSRDGRWLLYSVTAPGGWDTWALDVAAGRARAFLDGARNEVQARISPDGRYLAYASDESGAWNIYVRPFPEGAGKWLVSTEGGIEPLWRSDGRELFYVDAAGRLVAAPVTIGETFQHQAGRPLFPARIPDTLAPFRRGYAVSPDGQQFLLNVVQPDSDPSAITVVLDERWD